jgi:hypothetical protein
VNETLKCVPGCQGTVARAKERGPTWGAFGGARPRAPRPAGRDCGAGGGRGGVIAPPRTHRGARPGGAARAAWPFAMAAVWEACATFGGLVFFSAVCVGALRRSGARPCERCLRVGATDAFKNAHDALGAPRMRRSDAGAVCPFFFWCVRGRGSAKRAVPRDALHAARGRVRKPRYASWTATCGVAGRRNCAGAWDAGRLLFAPPALPCTGLQTLSQTARRARRP